MRERHEAYVGSCLLEPLQGRKQRKSALVFAELSVNAEIGPVCRKISP
jgi:hypothetical protein